jgi:3-oxo-5-alpha-steroid 4-dehydrogenase 1
MHLIVFLASVVFNVLNGSLLGTWLGGRTLPTSIGNTGAVPPGAIGTPAFWAGVGLMVVGFAGNVYHDQILFNLRKPGPDGRAPPRYSIPHGGLYSAPLGGVSLPSYLCEWVEWAGFALACTALAPPPALPLFDASTTFTTEKANVLLASVQAFLLQLVRLITPFVPYAGRLAYAASSQPSALLLTSTYLTPPWLFLYNEVAAMVPRAVKSHQWYQAKFGAQFPRGRKAVIPGVL